MCLIQDRALRFDQKIALLITGLCRETADHLHTEGVDRGDKGRGEHRDLTAQILSHFSVRRLCQNGTKFLFELRTHIGCRGIRKCHDQHPVDTQFTLQDARDDTLRHDGRFSRTGSGADEQITGLCNNNIGLFTCRLHPSSLLP